MAVKIVRQPNKIIVLGSPTSAAAMAGGHEGAPAALRKAGLIDRLRSIGYEVEDFGDDPVQLSKPDEESPRARNITGVLASINALKPRVELAVKASALPLILGGDCSIALATVAGMRRYFRNVGLIYVDRDADLNTPATTPSGSLDGMVISHITGRGAAELVRFWSEPPLVRDPDVALFGFARLDPAEEETLRHTTLRSYPAADVRKKGPAELARVVAERIHGNKNEIVLHFDVDVIDGFAATNYPGDGGLPLDDVRAALEVFAAHPHLGAIEVTAYNPEKDPDGSGANLLIDLLADVLAKRLEALKSVAEPKTDAPKQENAAEVQTPAPVVAPSAAQQEDGIAASAPAEPGEAWSAVPDKDNSNTAANGTSNDTSNDKANGESADETGQPDETGS